jgi:hypothetical protein
MQPDRLRKVGRPRPRWRVKWEWMQACWEFGVCPRNNHKAKRVRTRLSMSCSADDNDDDDDDDLPQQTLPLSR